MVKSSPPLLASGCPSTSIDSSVFGGQYVTLRDMQFLPVIRALQDVPASRISLESKTYTF
ncbi:hypothetical protein KC19_VG322000 [Ceratodon purpureus]|uniref:Uncharacterized protein n=1 Tax=Ceratodon purpureus TaxID=3225 RepID=A0A8T0HWQ4_CERPU|nr:hypothetical protein KC19_VG322000 [Ceratodon purpureus]